MASTRLEAFRASRGFYIGRGFSASMAADAADLSRLIRQIGCLVGDLLAVASIVSAP